MKQFTVGLQGGTSRVLLPQFEKCWGRVKITLFVDLTNRYDILNTGYNIVRERECEPYTQMQICIVLSVFFK
jgi:hypothetical protein